MAERAYQISERMAGASATANPALASVIERNIAALIERRRREETDIGWQARLADAATRFIGNMVFIYLHLFCFGCWVAINTGLVPLIRPWDPSFAILGTVASVEAIFLATFILIRQNRMADADRKHADLDLQVSLLRNTKSQRSSPPWQIIWGLMWTWIARSWRSSSRTLRPRWCSTSLTT